MNFLIAILVSLTLLFQEPQSYPARVTSVVFLGASRSEIVTLDSNLMVTIQVRPEDSLSISEGDTVSLRFDCVRDQAGDCNFLDYYRFSVNNRVVRLVNLRICRDSTYTRLSNAWVAHGPGDSYPNGYMVHGSCGSKHIFSRLWLGVNVILTTFLG